MGFKYLGKRVKISDKASIYDASSIAIGNDSRIDDFCILSGNIEIGSYCHITPMCLIAGGEPGVKLSDFCTLAYGVKVFSQSDDYSGETMVNSLIPKHMKNEKFAAVTIERQVVVGAGSTILPGVTIAEGVAVGAMSLVLKSTLPWGIYAGVPAKRIKERKQNLLELEKEFLRQGKDDDPF
jgi:acetyltransferase-like isoleucine patch superfamily enzyme